MSSEANCWLSSDGLASVLNPFSSTPGGLPPKPPDPSFTEFPPLSPSLPLTTTRSTARSTIPTTVKPNFTFGSTASLFNLPPKSITLTSLDSPDAVMTDSATANHGSVVQKHSTSKPQPLQSQTYASKAKILSDRSLKCLAPTTSSPEGKPRVLVPDAVFARGAALHKEYIVGSFLGKMPDYGPIQSVLNFMWGKGSKLEIHLQPLKHSMLVKVPNDYIRSKILEKRLWYVDTAMFYVSQWGENPTVSYPEITSIPLWAHLRGVPFDLRTKEGLILAAGLVGEPIETDDYTKNVSSLNFAHVKVEANLCKPLPTAGELMRENSEIIDVDIDYPWTPPLCSHCCRIGHIVKNCIYPAVQVSHQDNAATATASVSLQGYSPHVQMDKGMQNNSTTTPPPLLPDPISQAETVVVDKMQVDSIVANPSTTSTLLESDSQLAVDLIADATPLPLVPETVTES
ncbi:hypothetical protein F2Q69_00034525 [Brassica cretica]|uniref:DUF4283 domain-containing protein n=1 Tax=Brassica cretica TaxID=69181 RepID=A0A8S9SFL2_BRACR|nr:hypothetical protein F2Q69_00034525 [Brassica cretica]